MIQFSVGERYFLFLHSIHMGSGTNPASHSVDARAFSCVGGGKGC